MFVLHNLIHTWACGPPGRSPVGWKHEACVWAGREGGGKGWGKGEGGKEREVRFFGPGLLTQLDLAGLDRCERPPGGAPRHTRDLFDPPQCL
jgi:hypothetical protein